MKERKGKKVNIVQAEINPVAFRPRELVNRLSPNCHPVVVENNSLNRVIISKSASISSDV